MPAKDKTDGGAVEASLEVEPAPEVDRVQLVSLRADGTPDQSPGHVVIGDEA